MEQGRDEHRHAKNRHGGHGHGGHGHTHERLGGESVLRETLSRMLKSPGAKIGFVILVVIIVACTAAPLIAPYGVNEIDIKALKQPPSLKHLLGTDALGRDLLTRLLYGGQYSILLGLCASGTGEI